MKTREMERALAAADPVRPGRLDELDLEGMEADLLADVEGEQAAQLWVESRLPRRRSRRRLSLALGSAAVAVGLAAFLIFAGGATEHPSHAYGADLVRFAEASPLLLLEGPGWRVQNAEEQRSREGTEGSMEFVTGKPIPYESIKISGSSKRQRRVGDVPARGAPAPGRTRLASRELEGNDRLDPRPAASARPQDASSYRSSKRPLTSTRGTGSTSTRAAPATVR